jgi:hypothetical protein
VLIGVLAVVAVLVLAWILWVVIESRSPVQWTTVGFRIVGNEQVDVTYDVHKDPDDSVTCTLRALDQGKATVGTADVVVGPSSAEVIRRTDTVRTSALAVTGFVRGCVVSGSSTGS